MTNHSTSGPPSGYMYSLGLHARQEPTQAWYWVLRGIVGITTIINNTLVLYVIATRRKLRQEKSNWFVLSLSTADLLVGIIITALQISEATHASTAPKAEMRYVVYDLLIDASILSLCALTLDRYRAIVTPLRYENYMTPYRAMFLIGSAWGIPLAVALARISMTELEIKDEKEREKMFVVIQTIFFITFPCITLTISYIRILLIVRRHSRKQRRQKAQVDYNYSTDSNLHSIDEDSNYPKASSSTEGTTTTTTTSSSGGKLSVHYGKKRGMDQVIIEDEVSESTASRILSNILSPKLDKTSLPAIGVVIVLFDCFWGFGVYSYFCDSFLPESVRLEENMKHILWLLILMNSAWNPLVYAILKKDIRKEIRKVLPCMTSARGNYGVESGSEAQPVNRPSIDKEIE
ncbi:predicted protein [Nematostella vectensis]|uniref:G-protein coupled receptors family 1 profile domain-containing protein n=1 Tax=Nematostella vectensis TaxID=45351 RepID=A7RUG4_NEMVE|nr:probable G-protein coupled receptor No18 [Nematostella vectensis]XP_032242800.1 probable G-protein coupled receptor No18 [Nematostella vectensis]XP_032242801.1 probable G-protein coupled receptor No18 [Nematostella vectensis]XP_048576227.1 probable G-protein coupled receptor No18 [Nematostella vectensis]EDO44898.1 predicted protein [Nematostella vectensis]|eukprot:XP_001636961.1 predicted protein [Nematostella vectensis]